MVRYAATCIILTFTLSFILVNLIHHVPGFLATHEKKPSPCEGILAEFPADFKGLIPAVAVNFHESLTDEDLAAIKKLCLQADMFEDGVEVLETMKERRNSLFVRLLSIFREGEAMGTALSTEAHLFVLQIHGVVNSLRQSLLGKLNSTDELQEQVYNTFMKYRALSAKDREDIRKYFPQIMTFFQNEKIQNFFAEHLTKICSR
uniref:Fatty-acid and retinol-binding protein 1 n=1 Tax=Steinernema glaseri TaxID=37863 RepID=A0A1I8AFD2_9BILA